MPTLLQQLEFARHIPVEQLAARVLDRGVARLESMLPRRSRVRPTDATLRPALPLFELAPPGGCLERTGDGWRATFLNHSVSMPGDVDWYALQGNPAHRLWRMHLHYFDYILNLPTAQAQLLIGKWIEAVRPYQRGNSTDAWTPYATSLRIVNWIRWLATNERIEGRFEAELVASLVEQASHVARHMERDIRGNHIVKNILALAAAAASLDCASTERWRRLALFHLAREVNVQVLSDGVHFERSPSYHMQVLSDFVQIRTCLPEPPAALENAIERMSTAASQLVHPDGGVALFNDSGLSMASTPTVVGSSHAGHICLPDAGYFGFRRGGDYLLADMGRLGPDALMAHAHADCGSFEWSVKGQRVVVDQGVFEYTAGHRRDWSRSSHSHNVLSLCGVDQADFFGSFRCGRRPTVFDVSFHPTADGFVLRGTHNGYSVRGSGANLTRSVRYDASGVRIIDTFAKAAPCPGQTAILLHPNIRAKPVGDGVELLGDAFEVFASASSRLSLEPAEYWPDLGMSLATHRIVLPVAAGTKRTELTLMLHNAPQQSTRRC